MLISSLIHRLDSPVYHDQTLAEALEWSQKQALPVVPVVDRFSGYFLGSIAVEDLLTSEPSALITTVSLTTKTTLLATQMIVDAWAVMMRNSQADFPVVDTQGQFLGLVHREELLSSFEHAMGFDQYGVSLGVECTSKEPDLRSMIHIIEMEGGRVLSVGVPVPTTDEELASVYLRLLSSNVDTCIASLKRHGYQVFSNYTPESESDLNDRVDELMRYLEL